MFKDVQILAVDNDRDSGALYAALFESYSVTVMSTVSIKEALNLLGRFVPDILVCEARFLGESIDPLIQQVRSIAQDRHKLIPIFVTSTCSAINLTEYLKGKVEAYQIKPIDLDQFVAEVWNLILLSEITQPFTAHDWLTKLDISKTCYGCEGMG
jgi:response regulator RpfG family c-di-GMP phosphodiesterase